jgi:hypothetical protein
MTQFDRAEPLFAKAAAVLEPVVRDYVLVDARRELEVDARRELGATYFDQACLAGLIAADSIKMGPPPADSQQQFDRLAGEAIERLRKSWDNGFLQERAYFAHRAGDPDLHPFRDRDDFKKLVAEFKVKLAARNPSANP